MIKALDFTNNEVVVEYANARRYYLSIDDLEALVADIARAKLMLIHRPNKDMEVYCPHCMVAPVSYKDDWCEGCLRDEEDMPF